MDEAILGKKALNLPAKDRALLADALLVSLDDEATKAIEAEWVEEAESRYGAYQDQKIEARDGKAVVQSIKEKYQK
ncbi:addiction module protein [Puniceicoccaceae bacterium K14]|nr:addiction module protein [Puniceicoccaceae bacterium K14]